MVSTPRRQAPDEILDENICVSGEAVEWGFRDVPKKRIIVVETTKAKEMATKNREASVKMDSPLVYQLALKFNNVSWARTRR